jgi:hypothetical protein
MGSDIEVKAVLPSIIDRPVNRVDMPNADFQRWVAAIASTTWTPTIALLKLSSGTAEVISQRRSKPGCFTLQRPAVALSRFGFTPQQPVGKPDSGLVAGVIDLVRRPTGTYSLIAKTGGFLWLPILHCKQRSLSM